MTRSVQAEPEAVVLPSGLKAAQKTGSRWPLSASFSLYAFRSLTSVPAAASQIFRLLSRLPVTICVPAVFQATQYTGKVSFGLAIVGGCALTSFTMFPLA